MFHPVKIGGIDTPGGQQVKGQEAGWQYLIIYHNHLDLIYVFYIIYNIFSVGFLA